MNKILNRLIIYLLSALAHSCATQNSISGNIRKIEIVKIDSTDIYYVFSTNNKKNPLIIGEKEKFAKCLLSEKYIIKDSIKETPYLKDGKRQLGIGFYGFELDGVPLKKAGELVKYIDDCKTFSR